MNKKSGMTLVSHIKNFLKRVSSKSANTHYDSTSASTPTLFRKANDFDRPDEAIREGIYPYFRIIESPLNNGTEYLLADGKRVIMFGSNDYLGLSHDARVIEASIKATKEYGTGFGGSRFLNGNSSLHTNLEKRLSDFLGKPAVYLFSTGYQANQGIVPLINSKETYVVWDSSDHASIISAIQLTPSKKIRFKHNDTNNLEKKLKEIPIESDKIVIVEGVYSMEGDIANLPKICSLAQQYNAALMVDDAHGIGVLGRPIEKEKCTNDGRGTTSYYNLENKVNIIMGTFSKSLGTIGGFLAADEKIIYYLKHNASSGIFSASLPAPLVAAALKSLEIIQNEPERIYSLAQNTKRMREGLARIGYKIGGDEKIPIVPVYIGGLFKENREINALLFAKNLEEEGLFVNPVLSPAVRSGNELIRVSLMSTHTNEQIDYALDKFEKVGKNLGLI